MSWAKVKHLRKKSEKNGSPLTPVPSLNGGMLNLIEIDHHANEVMNNLDLYLLTNNE